MAHAVSMTEPQHTLHNGLSLVNIVQFGLSLLDQSFWNIFFFQAENLNISFHR